MSYDSDDEKTAAGAAIVEKLGLLAKANPALSDDLRAHTLQALFGTIWTRDGLELKTRSLITLTTLIALTSSTAAEPRAAAASSLAASASALASCSA